MYELAKRGMLPETDVMVDLINLNLEYVKVDGSTLKIGAMSRFAWLLKQACIPEDLNLADCLTQ